MKPWFSLPCGDPPRSVAPRAGLTFILKARHKPISSYSALVHQKEGAARQAARARLHGSHKSSQIRRAEAPVHHPHTEKSAEKTEQRATNRRISAGNSSQPVFKPTTSPPNQSDTDPNILFGFQTAAFTAGTWRFLCFGSNISP